jgi:hypothetical protein
MSFNDYCNLYKTDKGNELPYGNNYANFYESWFLKIKETTTHICEIGVELGKSLKVHQDYFQNAQIFGLDVENKSEYDTDRIKTFILDQSNSDNLDSFVSFCNSSNIKFDFILDDGSHDVEHQQLTFGKLFPLVKSGGLYIIEDLGSSYFTLGTNLYGYIQTQTKINNNTIKFLNQRPFSSVWISEENLDYINNSVEYVSIFDNCNKDLPYSNDFICENNYPIRSITSIIKKK